jgi:hypothetical protein
VAGGRPGYGAFIMIPVQKMLQAYRLYAQAEQRRPELDIEGP